MSRLSKLSEECISHDGLCCEERLNVIFKDGTTLRKCPHFKKPRCSIYKCRPIDCKAYPVSIDLKKGQTFFVIDLKCPAVKKGLINKRFLNSAEKLWKDNWPEKEWIIQNAKDNRNKEMYEWITIEEYITYKHKLKNHNKI